MYVLKRQLIREMGQGMSDVCGKSVLVGDMHEKKGESV